MQSAKDSVKSFMAKAGHHDTTVHESVNPAVQHEVVKPVRHEEVVTATDREVHQDHYHHTVQPVHDREVLPEKHEHNLAAVQHREIDHRDHDSTKHKLAEVASGFKSERVVEDTKRTQAVGQSVGGEHIHHHVHETIQPVVHKETIQPNVVHTTVPIHEVHHKAATHHNTTELPAVSLADFKSKGGALGGREERYDGFEGEPKNIGGVLGAGHTSGQHGHSSHHTGTGAGLTGAGAGTGLTGSSHNTTRQGEGLGQHGLSGRTDGDKYGNVPGQTHSGLPGTHSNTTGTHSNIPGSRTTGTHSNTTGTHNTATGQKPSIIQKLNPFSDADGDGKKGINE